MMTKMMIMISKTTLMGANLQTTKQASCDDEDDGDVDDNDDSDSDDNHCDDDDSDDNHYDDNEY